ncbi:MAG: hypothetical protein RQ966_11025 [Acetobacteraceae bacterium]|nr:hypothetical protein [Acetobacteraceae bacterium]
MPEQSSPEIILLRLNRFAPEIRDFGSRLQRESGRQLICFVDETQASVDVAPFPKVSLTVEALRRLRLHVPPDVGWRCGDYGFYLARTRFPSTTHFWMIEYDVRISGHHLADFFDHFATHPNVDLIAADLRQTDGWFWRDSVRSRNVPAYRCFFPLTRLSAPAIDRLLLQRQSMSRNPVRRLFWANDEALVATTLANDGSLCRDLNGFGRQFYTEATFSYIALRDGDALNLDTDEITLYHPVLRGEDYQRKLVQQARPETRATRFRRRVARVLSSQLRW